MAFCDFLFSEDTRMKERLQRGKLLVSIGIVLFFGFSLVFFISAFFGKPAEAVAIADLPIGDTGLGGGASYPETYPTLDMEPDLSLFADNAATLVVENGAEDEAMTIGALEPEEYSRMSILSYTSYKVVSGDMVGGLAVKFGLNQDTIISINAITNTRLLQINQTLRIPNQDGILYTVKKGDTLSSIASEHEVDVSTIKTVNELFSDTIAVNTKLFIPGARLDQMDLREINGDVFLWPVRGRITSNYGYRANPFGGTTREFHSGMDIAVPLGTPVRAALSGRVTSAGWDNVYGNFVVITHYSNYRTLYGHMSALKTKVGAYVVSGETIGLAGSTGRSTGPHVHFTVYKNGVTTDPSPLLSR
jgi:murein DD-endopeptidase MepM/ murein hydrolase activator NlpD